MGYSCLNRKRGTVVEETNRPGTPMYNVKAYLPVAESFGFTSFLRQNTAGQAFPQMVFHHWETVNADPFTDDKMAAIVLDIRKRKSLGRPSRRFPSSRTSCRAFDARCSHHGPAVGAHTTYGDATPLCPFEHDICVG